MADDPFWDAAWTFVANEVVTGRSLRRARRQQRQEAASAPAGPPMRKKRKREDFPRLPLNPEEPVGKLARWRWDPQQSPWWKLIRRSGVRKNRTGSKSTC